MTQRNETVRRPLIADAIAALADLSRSPISPVEAADNVLLAVEHMAEYLSAIGADVVGARLRDVCDDERLVLG